MATTLVPGTHTGLDFNAYQRRVEPATYQMMEFIPSIEEGDRPYNQLTVDKWTRVSSTELTQTTGGDTEDLTYAVIIGTPITVTTLGHYVAIAWSQNMEAQTRASLEEAKDDMIRALAEGTDTTALEAVSGGTQNMSQADALAANLRQGIGRLAGNTNGMAMPGNDKPVIHGIFTHKQYPNLVAIPEVNSAEMRGDSENPFVKGVWVKGFGFVLHLTTVIENDANGDHNCLYIPSAFVVAWNQKSFARQEINALEHHLIIYNNVGTAIKHDERLIDFRTTASAL
jgi:hypothetical protein